MHRWLNIKDPWYITLKYLGVRGDPPTHYIKVRSEINSFKLREVDPVDVLQGPPQARENFGIPKHSLC